MLITTLTFSALAYQSRPALRPRATRAARGASACMMAGKVVVSDGTESFYESRGIFQMLHDHAEFDAITALSGSTTNAKKMLLSRQARYSGLLDLLTFSEGESEAFTDADTWVSINSDSAKLSAQLAAAKAAGVKRVLLHFSPEGPSDGTDADGLSGELSGLTYTVLRTGTLAKTGAGGGLKVGELTEPECGEPSKDDVFRLLTEALTLDSAAGKMLSLCASQDLTQLKEMRQAGCSRREEADALLSGKIKEPEAPKEKVETSEEKAAREVEESKADEVKAASDEEELQMLIQRARQRGIEEAEKTAKEEEEKMKLRAERDEYYKTLAPPPKDDDDAADDDKDEPPTPPPAPPPAPPPPPSGGPTDGDDDKKDGGDDDRLQAA